MSWPAAPSPSSSAPPTPVSITICGDGGCGKSSITLRLVRSQWTSEYDPTIEDSYSVTRCVDGRPFNLALTDTAGQEEYRGLWAASNLAADAFLLVYDVTSPDSLHALCRFNDMIDMEADSRADNLARAKRAGVPPSEYAARAHDGIGSAGTVAPVKIVAGNKCDLVQDRLVPAAVGLDWARARGCGFMETSARNEVNIEETFALIVRRVMAARRAAEGHPAPHVPAGPYGVFGRPLGRGMTKPLPLPKTDEKESRPSRPHRPGRPIWRFWRRIKCWASRR